jgi:hypothetical protein
MPIPDARDQLVTDPAQAKDAEQINNEKAALVDDIRDVDLFPNAQFVFF